MIERDHELPLSQQCQVLEISRSSQYYRPVAVSQTDLALMRAIDELHLAYPFYGSRRMRNALGDQGFKVGRRHVQTLMDKMGIEALYPKPRLSEPHPGHKVWPYLLREVAVTRPNQVWACDITYVPLAKGFAYLVAIIDWYSRKVLSWRLSNCPGHLVLCGGAGRGAHAPRQPRNLQYGSGQSIHRPGLHPPAPGSGHTHQHGRARALGGQRLCGTSLAQREIRGGVSEGLRVHP
jgi:putative transposase